MSRVGKVTLVNWMRFRGEHSVELGEGVYSLVGRWEGDVERSNWGGKSAFLDAIAYAAVGFVDREKVLDDLVTRGEDEASVEIELWELGERRGTIRREIRRGKGATLEVSLGKTYASTMPWQEPRARGDAAQKMIDELLVGFSRDDFLAGPHGRQKQLDALIRATPAVLMEKIGAWFELDELREGEALCREVASAAKKDRDRAQTLLVAARERLDGLPDADELAADAERLRREVETARAQVEYFENDFGKAKAAEALEREAERLEREIGEVEAIADKAKVELEKLPTRSEVEFKKLRAAVADSSEKLGKVRAERDVATLVAFGKFDGKCPVAGIACPAKDEINRMGDDGRKRLRVCEIAVGLVEKEAGEAAKKRDEALEDFSRRQSKEQQVENLRERWDRLDSRLVEIGGELDGLVGEKRDVELLASTRAAAKMSLGSLESRLRETEYRAGERKKAEAEVEKLSAELGAAAERSKVAGRAVSIFSEAQRVIAESVLGEIEQLANRGLSGAGIALSVEVRWRREERGLADDCSECGQAFPRSKKVRECPACGAARGAKVDEYPQIRPSDRSGAADCMSGALTQAAAAAYLRGVRGAGWNTLVLDEPGEGADPANSRALAAALRTLLCGPAFGFDQAIVASHDAATQDAFERKIVVVAGPDGSRLEVA